MPLRRGQRSASDEVNRRHVDDQAVARYHQGRDRRPSVRRAGNVQIPAQGRDNMTVTCAGTQLYTRHGSALAKLAGGGVWTQRFKFLEIRIPTRPRRHKPAKA
jgi:hypothetical protein